MPLIRCPDCQHKVSARAPVCPRCGAPINGDTAAPKTEEACLKLHGFLAALMLVCGVGLFFTGLFLQEAGQQVQMAPAILWSGIILSISGFLWALLTRFRSWWYD